MVAQCYESELGFSSNFVKVLPRTLTLRPDFVARRFDDRGITLFEEVSVIKPRYVLAQDARDSLHTEHTIQETKASYFSRVLDALKEIVYAQWLPDHAHAIFHSSGIDSRLLSLTIRELWKEHGDQWLGKVLFLCSKWEGLEFEKIMDYEGWSPEQYWTVDEYLPYQYYYQWSLEDFAGAWERHNGVSAIPVNLFWYPVAKAQESKGFPTEKVQVFSGQWGNTTMDETTGENIKQKLIMFYYSVLRQRTFKGDVVNFPFAEAEFVKTILSSEHRIGKALRPELLKFADKKLSEFVNMMADGDRHRRIADTLIKQMFKDYQNSEYGKRIGKAKLDYKTTEFQPFWSRWTAASLCQYLIEKGYKIKWQTT